MAVQADREAKAAWVLLVPMVVRVLRDPLETKDPVDLMETQVNQELLDLLVYLVSMVFPVSFCYFFVFYICFVFLLKQIKNFWANLFQPNLIICFTNPQATLDLMALQDSQDRLDYQELQAVLARPESLALLEPQEQLEPLALRAHWVFLETLVKRLSSFFITMCLMCV